MDDLALKVVTGLLEMRDAPDPAQGFGSLARHIGVDDAESVYAMLNVLVDEGVTHVCERRYQGSLSSATGWDVVSVERAEAFLAAGGRLFPIAAPGPRSRPSALAQQAA